MSTEPATPADILLATGVSVAQYRRLEEKQDRAAIAKFVRTRFSERYLRPVLGSKERNGFAMMALACLMIEALESFRNGWPRSDRRGERAFSQFFQHYSKFAEFAPAAGQFYRHIRCGLLHQAETTGGWRIRRKGPLFERGSHTVNAAKFLRALEAALSEYCSCLESEHWQSEVWKRIRKKMKAVCANAGHP